MSSRKKAESYKLYSCTHLERAKINIKIDKNHQNRKIVTYISKPNPSVTINSANGQTTVFLPPSRSLLNSNESEKDANAMMQYPNSFGYDMFPGDTSEMKMGGPPIFPYGKSEYADFDFSNETHPSRYKPNILKTKSAKVQINKLKDAKVNNKKDLVKEKCNRKRKQTYNLSNIGEDDVILHESKKMKSKTEEKHFKNQEKCKKIVQKKPKQGKGLKKSMKIREKENSCARACPYTAELFDKPVVNQNAAFPSLIKECHVSLEFLKDIENYEGNPKESLLEAEDPQVISAKSPAGIVDLGEVSPEYQIANESFRETSTESEFERMDIPINSEFFVPDYLDYLSTSDSISESDEVHKLISPSVTIDVFDMFKFPSMDDEPLQDINGNDLKSLSSVVDLEEEYRNYIAENKRDGFMNSIKFENYLDDMELNSIKSTNVQEPADIPHFGAKDSLINGCRPSDIFPNIQGYESNLLDTNPVSDEKIVHNPQVIVELNKFFLSCARVECFDEKGTQKNCDLHRYVNDQVPVSPKTLMEIEEPKREDTIIDYLEKKTEMPKRIIVQKESDKVEVRFERYHCPDCDIVFGKKRSLTIHRTKSHSGFYTYTCNRCAMLCNSKSHLKRHSQSCGGIKKALVCFVCTKKYSYKSSLKQHLKNKHNVLQE